MSDYRTDDEVRSYDLFKGTIAALIAVGIFVLYAATRGDSAMPISDAALETPLPATEATESVAGVATEAAEIAAPDLLSPAPGTALQPGPVTFSGMGTPGSQVAISAAGRELGRAAVDDNGTWQLDLALPEDTQDIELQALDSAGNVVARSPAIPMSLLSAQPTETVESEAQNQATQVAEPTVDFPPADLVAGPITLTGSGEPGTTVRVLANGANVGEAIVDDSGLWTLDTTLAAGDYEIDLQLLDEDGSVVATTPAISLPVAAAEPPAPDLPAQPVPPFNPLSGALALAGSSAPGSRVAALVDDAIAGEAIAGEDGQWTIDLTLPAGSYDLAFAQLDAAGNPTAQSQPVGVEVPAQLPRLDLPAFSLADDVVARLQEQETESDDVPVVEPPDAEVGGDAYPADEAYPAEAATPIPMEATPLPEEAGQSPASPFSDMPLPALRLPAGPFTWTGSAAPGAEIAVIVDGEPAGTVVADEDGAFTFEGDLPEGERTVQLGLVGADGTVLGQSQPITVTVVNAQPPEVTVAEELGEDGSLAVSGSAAPGAAIEVTVGGESVGQTTAADDGSWSLTFSPPAATAILRARVLDESGEPLLFSSPVTLPGEGEAVAEAPDVTATPVAEESEENAPGTVSGAVTFAEQVDLPQDATVTVQIIDLSVELEDGTAPALGEQIIEAGGDQPPIAYEIAYDAAAIDEDVLYGVTARIESGDGALLFINESAAPVITNDNPTSDVEIVTVPVQTVVTGEGTSEPTFEIEDEAAHIAEAIELSGEFSILAGGLEQAGLNESLADIEGAYTLFAPTDEAFEAIPPGLLLGWDAQPEEFVEIMRYLVVEGQYLPEDLTDGLVLQTLAGTNIGITNRGELIEISGVPVIDMAEVGQSVIYAMPQVILPPLPAGITPPVIDVSGVPVFSGPTLTVVGVAEPGFRILVTEDGEPLGSIATVQEDGTWQVVGDVGSSVRTIIAYMIDDQGLLRAISQTVQLPVPE